MRIIVCLVASILALTTFAQAQDCNCSKVEVFGGYAYLNAYPGNDQIRSDQFNSRYSLNGFGVNIAVNPYKKIGFVGDFSWHKNETDLGQLTLNGDDLEQARTEITRSRYLFGVRFSARTEETNIFAHFLAGVANQKVKASVIIPGTDMSQEVKADSTDFALGIGTGIDVSASRHIAIRIVQFDYTPYRGDRNSDGTEKAWSHDYRLQVGIVYRWGLMK